jgi:Domain of unknown function (DUF4190)
MDEPPLAPPPPPPPAMPAPREGVTPSNGLATASLVLGILSVVLFFTWIVAWVLAIPAIVFGVIGIARANQGATGKSMAVSGLVLGIVGIAIGILLVVAFVSFENDGTSRIMPVCVDQENC